MLKGVRNQESRIRNLWMGEFGRAVEVGLYTVVRLYTLPILWIVGVIIQRRAGGHTVTQHNGPVQKCYLVSAPAIAYRYIHTTQKGRDTDRLQTPAKSQAKPISSKVTIIPDVPRVESINPSSVHKNAEQTCDQGGRDTSAQTPFFHPSLLASV